MLTTKCNGARQYAMDTLSVAASAKSFILLVDRLNN